MAEEKKLEAKCHCGAVHLTFTVPTSQLPLPTHLCHCSLCRYMSGTPAIFHAPIVGIEPEFVAPSSEASLSSYTWDGRVGESLFCSTCGCHVASRNYPPPLRWVVATSIFKDSSDFEIKRHIYANSAKDGGIHAILPRVGPRDMAFWEPEATDPKFKPMECELVRGEDGEERLKAECQCGGVSFTVARPSREDAGSASLAKLVAADGRRWSAEMDLCNDCRLNYGTHVQGFAFVPFTSIEPAVGLDLKLGTSRTYASSDGVLRSFCGVCSASVFYFRNREGKEAAREDMRLDVCMGILRAPEGVMAESWLDWGSEVYYQECGMEYDAGFAGSFVEGYRAWLARRKKVESE